MTSLLNIAGNVPTDAFAEGSSLRFEDGDSAYLSFTPASAGNQKTWTWSGWIKPAAFGKAQPIFSAYTSSTNYTVLGFDLSGFIGGGDSLKLWGAISNSTSCALTTNAVFRDPSAWYHVLIETDTTQATAADRIKIYVNGDQVTSFSSATYPAQNANAGIINAANLHQIGTLASGTYGKFDGYLANVAFIDGQALTPTSFGEYEDTLWKPKSDTDIQALTFGTNGFYLPMKQTTEAEGFSTVTWTGNGGTHGIEGLGLEPDFVWIKDRTTGSSHRLHDSVRGAGIKLSSDTTAAEVDESSSFTSFDADGFSLAGSAGAYNTSGRNYVAWCWDAGTGSAVSNTDGATTSNVKANTDKGFSICTWTVGSENSTVGHGLNSAPEVILMKSRSYALGWAVQHTGLTNMTDRVLALNSTSAEITAGTSWSAPTSTTFGTSSALVISGETWVGYCFHSVSGYSSIGSYSGTGASGNAVTTGFRPAWLMIKNADNATNSWAIFDNTRDTTNPLELNLFADDSLAESDYGGEIEFTSTGFTVNSTNNFTNQSGNNIIYMAFADTRDATFFGDTSGNGNNWTPNALNNTDVVLDSPVSGGNFATANPIDPATDATLSEGNLKCVCPNTGTRAAFGNFAVSSGKWYFEGKIISTVSSRGIIGVASVNDYATYADSGWVWYYGLNGQIYYGGSGSAYGSSFNTAVIGVALNMDDREVTFYLNGVSQGVKNLNNSTDAFIPLLAHGQSSNSTTSMFNFGQDSSFAGNETPQGNTDDNGVGDFYYAPPSGFLALNTGNLPTPTITAPDDYFNTLLWTGDGTSSRALTNVGFQPDFLWTKPRSTLSSSSDNHWLFDVVRGSGASSLLTLASSSNAAEFDGTGSNGNVTSLDADGFTITGGTSTNDNRNKSGVAYVAWNWLAGNGTVSNTDGSITSTVSANQTAGFSIVNYTGDGGTGETSVGHGLSQAPELIIYKNRDATGDWPVTYTVVDGSNDFIYLNSTVAAGSATQTLPTSSVFYIQSSAVQRNSGQNYIQYCFHSVEGYSKIGSYTGNGSTDGTFVHCGFRPAWVMVKRTEGGASWYINDAKRSPHNVSNSVLIPDGSFSEQTEQDKDLLSNGFKIRASDVGGNSSGETYIFIAFAEAPFKSANAR